MRKNLVVVILTVLGFALHGYGQTSGQGQGRYFGANPVNKSSGVGITLSFGSGIFVAANEDYYGEIKADLYPEVGIMIDASVIRVGLRAGLIYRKYEGSYYYYDYYTGEYYYFDYEATLAFVPLQVDLLVAPEISETASFYLGIAPGVFVPAGDNDEVLPAISVKMGLEVRPNPLVLYGDIRYTYAKDEVLGSNYNAGGIMVVAGVGIRIGN